MDTTKGTPPEISEKETATQAWGNETNNPNGDGTNMPTGQKINKNQEPAWAQQENQWIASEEWDFSQQQLNKRQTLQKEPRNLAIKTNTREKSIHLQNTTCVETRNATPQDQQTPDYICKATGTTTNKNQPKPMKTTKKKQSRIRRHNTS